MDKGPVISWLGRGLFFSTACSILRRHLFFRHQMLIVCYQNLKVGSVVPYHESYSSFCVSTEEFFFGSGCPMKVVSH